MPDVMLSLRSIHQTFDGSTSPLWRRRPSVIQSTAQRPWNLQAIMITMIVALRTGHQLYWLNLFKKIKNHTMARFSSSPRSILSRIQIQMKSCLITGTQPPPPASCVGKYPSLRGTRNDWESGKSPGDEEHPTASQISEQRIYLSRNNRILWQPKTQARLKMEK